jgi:hypothetical protein
MTARTTYPVAQCRSASCAAPVIWARTSSGELMPVNPDPDPDGNVELMPPGAGYDTPTAIVHPADQPTLWAGERYVSHFATCPEADQWRDR